MNSMRHQVLKAFKALHKARKKVFVNDAEALEAARQKINAEYRKNRHVNNVESVKELIAFSRSIENELITSVIQAQEVSPGIYRLRITEETRKLENVPFKDCGN